MSAVLAAIAWKHCDCTERAKNEAPYSSSPHVVGFALVGVLQEVQVRRDQGVRHSLRRSVELGVQPQEGQVNVLFCRDEEGLAAPDDLQSCTSTRCVWASTALDCTCLSTVPLATATRSDGKLQ